MEPIIEIRGLTRRFGGERSAGPFGSGGGLDRGAIRCRADRIGQRFERTRCVVGVAG